MPGAADLVAQEGLVIFAHALAFPQNLLPRRRKRGNQ